MGSRCSRSPLQGCLHSEGLLESGSEQKRQSENMDGDNESQGASSKSSYCDSLESKPVGIKLLVNAQRVDASSDGQSPLLFAENPRASPQGLLFEPTSTAGAEANLPIIDVRSDKLGWVKPDTPLEEKCGQPQRINGDIAHMVSPAKRADCPSTPEEGVRRCQTLSFPRMSEGSAGFHPYHQGPRSEDGHMHKRNRDLDQSIREFFIEFYERNLKEQQRHEEALKAGKPVPQPPTGVISKPDAERCLAEPPPFKVSPNGTEVDKKVAEPAEVEAARAISVFSPDERNTRVVEFSALVKTDHQDYDAERRRGQAIRGPNRASTIDRVRRS
ncbi:hypothetical protein Efla_005782 [Eimeria flavescens]